MATNFEPYQSSPDESDRVESPPTISSPSQPRISNSSIADPWAAARAQRLPSPSRYTDDDDETTPALADAGGYQDIESQRFRNDYIGPTALAGTGPPPNNASLGNVFETSLGIPLGYEALIAYLLLPPAGGMVLLLFEHKSDYVRFHAWQSALLFSALFLVHIIFSWTKIWSREKAASGLPAPRVEAYTGRDSVAIRHKQVAQSGLPPGDGRVEDLA
ncbi:hypothetical protein LTR91_021329 [Friedmanniomyces endolithicus]|uniref:Uncharacterized protein n=1 Tax=Friedmanniomyces endolithicus TaxID=329885 RepID=A0AAN6HAD5_9PEZI|nr:hypothetical protein LTR94_015188 [Friedmanniomyces endolithicus]KAK0780167.1 hypothetical protein LTR38_014164 [Friedmanniomyces endolithicus]KAK0791846.1 hypothetical protein LTR59_008783 [Friedmanniomyces endolithicus]KAK0835365.1 hypothetical protein LTR03_013998 [Friedmanniomyces endolithicus]KAK0852568.1 hypothetical protein LTS02_012300 [Friedmanniomyces endolithicus]